MKRVAIFGAGAYGVVALDKIGAENVDYFLDNNMEKQHTLFKNIEVITLEEFMPQKDKYHVVIASRLYASEMEAQIKAMGITDYSNVIKYLRYSETDELVHNPYESKPAVGTEEEFNSSKTLEAAREVVYKDTEELYGKNLLFSLVEVETINRCNDSFIQKWFIIGKCSEPPCVSYFL